MLALLLHWVLSALGLLLVARLVPGFEISGFGAALVAVVAIALVNATIGLVLKILTFPLTIVTLGIFWLVINAAMLKLAAAFVPGFAIEGFLPAFLGGLVLSLLNIFVRMLTRGLREEQREHR
jgi:putative membrane protein